MNSQNQNNENEIPIPQVSSPLTDQIIPTSPNLDQSDDEGEELIHEHMDRDYRQINELDTYESEGIDTKDYDEIGFAELRAAEREMDKRDRKKARKRGIRIPKALQTPLTEDEEEDLIYKRRRLAERSARGALNEEEESLSAPIINIDKFSGPFLLWIQNDAVSNEIKRLFRSFLHHFRGENHEPIYLNKIRVMCQDNRQNLNVDYNDIGKSVPNIAIWIADYPSPMFEILDDVAMKVTLEAFPEYTKIRDEIHVRLMNLPIDDKIRELRQLHLGRLIRVNGVVTRRTAVFPQLKCVHFTCVKCNAVSVPILHKLNDKEAKHPGNCVNCQSKGPFQINQEKTIYRNFQRITLQETPGTVPAGRVPRSKEIILTNDLINCVRPGEEIEVIGIYKNQYDTSLNTKNGFPVFSTVIEANFIEKSKGRSIFDLTDEDRQKIREFSKKPNLFQIILNSIAPSIHNHKSIKTALACSLFGGTPKEADKGRHRLRGDINVLILGDPGTAKSQFLKYIEKTAPRAVYATGKGASAVGLTASVQKDPVTREWTLEGGALVLADQGVCLIDEFDKMNDHDRTSIHEAMEQQTISISKAGVVATLQARSAVIAAANPIRGRYDSSATFIENVDLTDPIISRFDILCVVKDQIDPIEDERLGQFVVKSHMKSHPLSDDGVNGVDESESGLESSGNERMSQDFLRKYIQYARNTVKPKINNIDQHKISNVYSELRKESMREGAIPIGVRHIESIIRIAESRARMHLRDYVQNDDVDVAVSISVNSFIDTQKFSVMRFMKKKFKKFLYRTTDFDELLFHILQELVKDEKQFRGIMNENETDSVVIEIDSSEFEAKAKQFDIMNVTQFYKSALFLGTFELDESRRKIVKTFV